MNCGMNITALRPRFIRYLEPVADVFVRLQITPNQISLLSLMAGIVCAVLFFQRQFLLGSLALLALCDLRPDRRQCCPQDRMPTLISGRSLTGLLTSTWTLWPCSGSGFPGSRSSASFFPFRPMADFAVVAFAIIGSLMNTFIKPVVYAEIGYGKKWRGRSTILSKESGSLAGPRRSLSLLSAASPGSSGHRSSSSRSARTYRQSSGSSIFTERSPDPVSSTVIPPNNFFTMMTVSPDHPATGRYPVYPVVCIRGLALNRLNEPRFHQADYGLLPNAFLISP